ncbi:MAG: hypothetical protein AAF512_08725 [Pseudomonadota bacterium]
MYLKHCLHGMLVGRMLFIQPAFADSDLRKDWQGVKSDLEEAFDEIYETEVTDKKLNK